MNIEIEHWGLDKTRASSLMRHDLLNDSGDQRRAGESEKECSEQE